MVMLFHFWGNLPDSSRERIPTPVAWLLEHGDLGVDIFFVLSGFVIAHSIRHGLFSLSYLGRFALRRSIRLDPPFWVTIALEVALIRVGLMVVPTLETHVPTFGEVALNATYAYRFFGAAEIIPVFWSLTYEVQFYFILVAGLVALRYLGLLSGRRIAGVLLGLTYVYSLLVWLTVFPLPITGIFLDRWFQFGFGVLAWLATYRSLDARLFYVVAVSTLAAAMMLAPNEFRLLAGVATVITGSLLVWAGHRGRMSMLGGTMIQFLGRISYSLYLLHLPIGWRVMTLGRMTLEPGALMGFVLMAAGIGCSVAAAWIMHVALEAPSMKLARRVTLPRRPSQKLATL